MTRDDDDIAHVQQLLVDCGDDVQQREELVSDKT